MAVVNPECVMNAKSIHELADILAGLDEHEYDATSLPIFGDDDDPIGEIGGIFSWDDRSALVHNDHNEWVVMSRMETFDY